MFFRTRLIRLLTFALVATIVLAAQAQGPSRDLVVGDELGLDVRPGDEVWMLSTRHLSTRDHSAMTVHRLGATRWNDSTRDRLERSLNRGATIVVYVHGNRMNFQDAADRGRLYYEQLSQSRGAGPLQFVVWSWPSAQIKGQLRDVRAKARRADFEAGLLADFVRTLPRRSPLSLIGYSYGARVISGALTDVSRTSPPTPATQAVFIAPALDVNWLGPGQHQSDAWLAMNRLMVMFNRCDPALKRFACSERCYKPTALGYVGPWWGGNGVGEVESENATGIVGKSHSELLYLGSPYLMGRMRQFLASPFGLEPDAMADYRP